MGLPLALAMQGRHARIAGRGERVMVEQEQIARDERVLRMLHDLRLQAEGAAAPEREREAARAAVIESVALC